MRVSSLYLVLTEPQQKLLGHLISLGVRTILKEGPAIDAAMSEARARFVMGKSSRAPELQLVVEVSVVESPVGRQTPEITLTVEGGGS